ncbi:MAG TPA: tetratricopeptide repeat protein [Sideroxyarcus sp.]|nr:tetratricopeptide repeat protein [Sideroxyarcus sp.]
MTRNYYYKLKCLIGGLLAAAISGNVLAQPLDDVNLEFQDQGVVATIRLTGPVRYVSHFPESHGKTLEIFYERVQGPTSNEAWVDNEVRNSPPSGLIPSFTVTTRDQQTKPKLVIEFAREAEYSVTAGKDNRSLLVTIRPEKRPVATGALPLLPAIPPAAAAPAGTLTAEQATAAETNKQARALMVQGRDALAAKNNEAAVEAFNKLLLLPPNDFTQDAQEWVGVARERANQKERAQVEYELYLRLYPEGESAARVAQRLAGLSGSGADQGIVEAGEKKRQARWMSFGAVSSRYYFGKSKIESTQSFNGAPETLSTTLTDQSMLITSLDASERYVSDEYDGRLVFRDVNTKNFLANKSGQNRVYAAYGEIKSRTQDYMVRVGRQSAYGGGVLGRFDGLSGGYGNAQELRVNAVVGSLADYSQGSKPKFFGASVDRGAFSFYGINQTVDGVQDRRGLGAEWRYFEDKNTAYALLDYDTYFKAVNAAQFMGTTSALDGTVSFMVDHRKAPSLSIRNALNGAGTSSINDLLQATSASTLRELALSRTAIANMGQIGLTVPWRDKWQVGGDFRLTNTTGLMPSGQTIDPVTGLPITQCTGTQTTQGCMNAQPGRGLEKSVTGQLIGSGLVKDGDIWSGSATYSTSSAVNGYSIFLYNHTLYVSGWTSDVSLQMYSAKDQLGGKTSRTSPMLRGAYRLREQIFLDVDGGLEFTKYSGAQVSTKTTRYFFSGGVRWDF